MNNSDNCDTMFVVRVLLFLTRIQRGIAVDQKYYIIRKEVLPEVFEKVVAHLAEKFGAQMRG